MYNRPVPEFELGAAPKPNVRATSLLHVKAIKRIRQENPCSHTPTFKNICRISTLLSASLDFFDSIKEWHNGTACHGEVHKPTSNASSYRSTYHILQIHPLLPSLPLHVTPTLSRSTASSPRFVTLLTTLYSPVPDNLAYVANRQNGLTTALWNRYLRTLIGPRRR